jgi:hypothetical protein
MSPVTNAAFRLTPSAMSQTSPTLKAEPEATASATTLATQTPPTSYTLTSQTSSRSYQHLDLGCKQNDMVLQKTSPFHLFTLILDRSGVQLVIICSLLPTTTGNMVTSQQPRWCLMYRGYLDIYQRSCDVERGIGDARR